MLRNLFPRFHPTALKPDEGLTLIGDVHGCADLLDKALIHAGTRRTICVGDYIDRGPDSATVLRTLHARPDVICIGGNHEDILLSFLDAPEHNGPFWMRNGGATTLESFGLEADINRATTPTAFIDLRDRLRDAMGDALIAWVRELPNYWVSGNIAVVHAAADPRLSMIQQDPRFLRWGHTDFLRKQRRDGLWVVHGHIVVPDAQIKQGRIAIDSGAYATGRLTVATITDGAIIFDAIT